MDVKTGDTILTSKVSFNFPPGYIIGTVSDMKLDNTTGMYLLKIKTAANFYNLQQVHIIENVEREEQVKLFDDTKKKIDQAKKNPR